MGSGRAIIRLWIEVGGVLKHYMINDPLLELRNIMDYYSSMKYQDMMHSCLL